MKLLTVFLLGLLSWQAVLTAASVNIQLVDSRQNPINNAQFYFRHKGSNPNGAFERGPVTVESLGRMVRIGNHASSFNHRLHYSNNVFDVKVVADGYKPFAWTQVWPAGGSKSMTFRTITLQRPSTYETDGTVDYGASSDKSHLTIEFLYANDRQAADRIADTLRGKGYVVLSNNLHHADVRRNEIAFHPHMRDEANLLHAEIYGTKKYTLKAQPTFPKNKITILLAQ